MPKLKGCESVSVSETAPRKAMHGTQGLDKNQKPEDRCETRVSLVAWGPEYRERR